MKGTLGEHLNIYWTKAAELGDGQKLNIVISFLSEGGKVLRRTRRMDCCSAPFAKYALALITIRWAQFSSMGDLQGIIT